VRHTAAEGRAVTGQVQRLAPSMDALTRALEAEVLLDNEGGTMRPGMFVEVTIVAERRENVTVVPRDAVTERDGKPVVFLVDGQRASRREVALGVGDDDVVEIREGVSPGQRVVVRGLETLTDGAKVRVSGA
jgi:RND family efflux transporter MFP subunit